MKSIFKYGLAICLSLSSIGSIAQIKLDHQRINGLGNRAMETAGKACEHSPIMIDPPDNRQYYMGELSKKDLRHWPSKDVDKGQMAVPEKKCQGK